MYYLQNHCWCSESIWGGMYSCRHLISIEKYKDYDPENEPEADWLNNVETKDYFDQDTYDTYKQSFMKVTGEVDEDLLQSLSQSKTLTLNKNVIKWLNENIEDREGEEINKGWAIGTDDYYHKSYGKFTLFFHREEDAMAFINKFSEYKVPTEYLNYFKDIRKKIDFETNKLELIKG